MEPIHQWGTAALEHEPEVLLGEVAQVRSDLRQKSCVHPEPACQRGSVLIRRQLRDHTSSPDVFGSTDLQERIATVGGPTLYRIADHQLHAAPRVVTAVAIRRQGSA